MGGATSVMPVIRGTRSVSKRLLRATIQWADTIDWTIRCD